MKRRIFEDLLDETNENGEKLQEVLKEIVQAMRRKQKPCSETSVEQNNPRHR